MLRVGLEGKIEGTWASGTVIDKVGRFSVKHRCDRSPPVLPRVGLEDTLPPREDLRALLLAVGTKTRVMDYHTITS